MQICSKHGKLQYSRSTTTFRARKWQLTLIVIRIISYCASLVVVAIVVVCIAIVRHWSNCLNLPRHFAVWQFKMQKILHRKRTNKKSLRQQCVTGIYPVSDRQVKWSVKKELHIYILYIFMYIVFTFVPALRSPCRVSKFTFPVWTKVAVSLQKYCFSNSL